MIVVLLLDQISKRWVVDNLVMGETFQPIPALVPFFQMTRSENTGAAFGLLPQAADLFLIIAVVVVVALILFYRQIPDHARFTRFGVGLVCGGALGNALNRLEYGAVVDFIHYQIPGVISNVSNLADHAIVIGVILIVIESWRADPDERAAQSRRVMKQDRSIGDD
ncbi:MAG: signal peptidase II [Chloroflexi bacterium]|nr:signal peptidase II [Chloroflexota bacterium]